MFSHLTHWVKVQLSDKTCILLTLQHAVDKTTWEGEWLHFTAIHYQNFIAIHCQNFIAIDYQNLQPMIKCDASVVMVTEFGMEGTIQVHLRSLSVAEIGLTDK